MANKTGGGSNRSAKDKQMAAHLKAIGDERKTGRCVICGKTITNAGAYNHYSAHSRGADNS